MVGLRCLARLANGDVAQATASPPKSCAPSVARRTPAGGHGLPIPLPCTSSRIVACTATVSCINPGSRGRGPSRSAIGLGVTPPNPPPSPPLSCHAPGPLKTELQGLGGGRGPETTPATAIPAHSSPATNLSTAFACLHSRLLGPWKLIDPTLLQLVGDAPQVCLERSKSVIKTLVILSPSPLSLPFPSLATPFIHSFPRPAEAQPGRQHGVDTR